MIKALFCDLDGTLLKNGDIKTDCINEENQKAIQLLKDNNVRFMIATGRSLDFLPRNFGKQYVFDTVGMAGAVVRVNNKIIYHSDFDHDEVADIIEILNSANYKYQLVGITLDSTYVFQKPTKEEFDHFNDPKRRFKDFKALSPLSIEEYIKDPKNPNFNCFAVITETPEEVNSYKMMLNMRFYNRYTFIENSPTHILLTKDGSDKGVGIFRICQALNISLNEVACVGDSPNDIGMFKMIPHSFCIDHAPDYVKSQATNVVKSVKECADVILRYNEEERLSEESLY